MKELVHRANVKKNQFLYPTNSTIGHVGLLSLATAAASMIAMRKRLTTKNVLLSVGASLSLFAFELGMSTRNEVKINSSLLVQKEASDRTKILENGVIIPQGEIVGAIHHKPQPSNNMRLNTSKYRRGLQFSRGMIDGLVILAEKCSADDELIRGLKFFTAKSYLVRPSLFKALGFTVETNVKSDYLSRVTVRTERAKVLGENEAFIDEPFNQFWATREQLVNALPALRLIKSKLSS